MYKNTKLALFTQIIIIFVSALALYLNFRLFNNWVGILYYTMLSNIFCFVFYLITVILKITKKLRKNSFYYCTKGLLLLSILCTMIIYNVFILPQGNIAAYVNNMFECNLVHLVVPLLALFECVFFEDKKVLKYRYLIYWASILPIYAIVLIIYSNLGGLFLEGAKYPYPIMDINRYGFFKCFLMCIGVFVIYEIIATGIVFVDNKMKERKTN